MMVLKTDRPLVGTYVVPSIIFTSALILVPFTRMEYLVAAYAGY